MTKDSLRVVIFKEGDAWSAQCLEYDIYARADSLDDVKNRMLVTLALESDASRDAGKRPFEGIDPAPTHYHAMWQQRSSFVQPEKIEGGDDGCVELALVA